MITSPHPLSGVGAIPPTRIAIIVPTHWEFLMGGAQLQAKLLLEELTSRPNISVAYLASRVNTQHLAPKYYQLTQIKPPGPLHRYGLFWDWRALNKALTEFAPHVIYQRVATAYTGIGARWAKANQVPFIWHIANTTDADPVEFGLAALRRPHRFIEQRLIQTGLTHASHIVVQSEDQLRQLQNARRSHGKSADTVSLIRNFQPIPPESPKNSAPTLEVLWIANLKDTKRPELAVALAQELVGRNDIRIRMIGAPYSAAESAKQQSIDNKVSELPNLEYLGELSLEQVNDLLSESHLLVNTSIKEGFSNTFIQAWFRKVPVASMGVNPDGMLDGGPFGDTFDSASSMAEYVRELADNRESLTNRGQKARERASSLFSLTNASDLADLLLKLRHDP